MKYDFCILSLQVFETISRTLLSVSHSGNFCVYCISNPSFRNVLYRQVCCVSTCRASMFRSQSSNPNIAVLNADNTTMFELTSNGRRLSNISGVKRFSDLIEKRRSSNISASGRISNTSRNNIAQNEFTNIKEETRQFLDTDFCKH